MVFVGPKQRQISILWVYRMYANPRISRNETVAEMKQFNPQMTYKAVADDVKPFERFLIELGARQSVSGPLHQLPARFASLNVL